MSEPEDFLARWSRRKREAAEEAAQAAAAAPAVPVTPAESADKEEADKPRESLAAQDTASDKPEPPFDLTRLQSLESITAETDVRAFLAPGVPAELSRAALRRAWAADPGIRDFVGLAENAWDFTADDAVAGFGPLEMTDDLRRQVMRMISDGLDPEGGDPPGRTAPTAQDETTTESVAAVGKKPTGENLADDATSQVEAVNNDVESRSRDELVQSNKGDTAVQHDPEKDEDRRMFVQRSHGRALPE